MAEKSYLTYYGEHGIIPVRQNTENLSLHFNRRRSLYRLLGLEPGTFKNSNVLEFGPGTGDNALYVTSCAPQLYVLVDENPASIRAISDKLERGLLPRDRVECRKSGISEYQDRRGFQVVLCEGVIPMQSNPEAFLSHVASFVAPGGIVVITTVSAISVCAEVCRRVLKVVISQHYRDERLLLQKLVSFFEPDLRSLPGMSRLHEDWVLDNILHPWAERFTFTIPEAVSTLNADFDVRDCSPRFIQDWRWYKSIPEDEKTWNDVALDQYDRWASYMLDYRIRPVMPARCKAVDLDLACADAICIHNDIWNGDKVERVPDFMEQLKTIGQLVSEEMPITAQSITDYLVGLRGLLDGKDDADFATFRSWFGRGQQYVSFTRR